MIVIDRGPADEDLSLIGTFPTKEAAQAFIEEAHDLFDEPCVPAGEIDPHMYIDDVDYATVAYMNEVEGGSDADAQEHRGQGNVA